MIVRDHNTPEYGVFSTSLSREQGRSVQAATKAVHTLLIDMVPSYPGIMMTTMMKATRLTNDTEQSFTIFTADQQLFRVMVDTIWVYPDLVTEFISRLGGMQLLMSFVGSVGTLIANIRLEEIMKSLFVGVAKKPLERSSLKTAEHCKRSRNSWWVTYSNIHHYPFC